MTQQRVERLPSLSAEATQGLLDLFNELKLYPAAGYTRRQGANASSNLSQYSINKIDMCPMAIRRRFREFFPKEYSDKAMTEYFLHLEANYGHLDRMVYWLDKYTSMRMYSYALVDNMCIQIDEPVGEHTLAEQNVGKFWGYTVWLGDDNAVLSKDNVEHWLGKTVNVRTPVKEHVLNKGEGISFVVNHVHQINRSSVEQVWACVGAAPFL